MPAMHRFLVETELILHDSPTLPKDAAQHLKVLRPEDGERFELFDGRGTSRVYVYAKGALVAASQAVTAPAPERTLTLFACVTKGSRWDWTIEKATELGVTRIVPVISDRTIVRIPVADRAAKRERWQRIAEDAARQSDAVRIPEILEPVDFKSSLGLVRQTTCFVGALVDPPAPALLAAAREVMTAQPSNFPTSQLSLYVGPEGDFTSEELSALLEIAVPTSFGPTVLRAETAAIFGLSVLSGGIHS
jgi:16S rRNA (uracil1498-N3)-methyltransferase